MRPGRDGYALVEGSGPSAGALDAIRHMLRLDADLSAFYAVAQANDGLAWVVRGAGRMMRSPTVFEDVVKTICTTNCAWSATVRMTTALVEHLGAEAPDGRRAFQGPPGWPRPVTSSTATSSAQGTEAPTSDARPRRRGGRARPGGAERPRASGDEVAERLLALPGCGPYATAHMMMLLAAIPG